MIQITPTRTLRVSSNGQTVGQLTNASTSFVFQYDPSWMSRPEAFPIAPSFPFIDSPYADDGAHKRVEWYFDNLLPEEKQRKLLAAEAGISPTDTWSLLRYCGTETAGALAVQAEDSPIAPPGRKPLEHEALANRIGARSHIAMLASAPKPIALAGAQAKLAVLDEDAGVFEPIGSQFSTHILKPDSDVSFYPCSAANEFFCMQLAGAVGLTVPKTNLYHTPAAVFSVARFDRELQGDQWRARHIIDGVQLLALGAHEKYRMVNAKMLRLCCELCTDPTATSHQIFDWAVYNVLIGNADAHLKNLSFFVDGQDITLAPMYDLLSTTAYATPDNVPFAPYWPEVKLSMPIGNALRYEDISRTDLLVFAWSLGIEQPLMSGTTSGLLTPLFLFRSSVFI